MNTRRLFFLGLILPLLMLTHCRRDRDLAQWDADLLAPVAHGSLNLSDLAPTDVVDVDSTGLLYLYFNDTLLRLGLDSLIGIPDTSFQDEFLVPIGNIQFAPGVPFYDTSTVTRYNLKGAQLTYVEVRSSSFEIEIENTTKTQLLVQYRIPSATDPNGNAFELERLIPPKSILTESFDLDGYVLDLRGRQGRSYNSIISEVTAMIDPAQTSNYTFAVLEGVKVDNTFKRIIPQYVKGYFGSQAIDYIDETPFEDLVELQYDRIDITRFEMNLTIDNGVGADLDLNIRGLGSMNSESGESTWLENTIIGNAQRFGRAVFMGEDANPPVVHQLKTFSFNDGNSNLDVLIELNPTRLNYDIQIGLNPLGNVALGNDFIYYGHDISASLDARIPLILGAEGLVLQDTFAFLFQETDPANGSDRIQYGSLNLYLENEYPLAADVQLEVLDEAGTSLLTLLPEPQTIEATSVDENNRAVGFAFSSIEVPVDPTVIQALKEGRFIVLNAMIDTYEQSPVALYNNHEIRFRLVADLNTLLP